VTKIQRPSISSRRPLSLYPVSEGESIYEFMIPGYAGEPECGGLIRIWRDRTGRMGIEISRVDVPGLEVIVKADDGDQVSIEVTP
jgi:hypothetical protein